MSLTRILSLGSRLRWDQLMNVSGPWVKHSFSGAIPMWLFVDGTPENSYLYQEKFLLTVLETVDSLGKMVVLCVAFFDSCIQWPEWYLPEAAGLWYFWHSRMLQWHSSFRKWSVLFLKCWGMWYFHPRHGAFFSSGFSTVPSFKIDNVVCSLCVMCFFFYFIIITYWIISMTCRGTHL